MALRRRASAIARSEEVTSSLVGGRGGLECFRISVDLDPNNVIH